MLEFLQFAVNCSGLRTALLQEFQSGGEEEATPLGDSRGKCCAQEQQGRSIAAVMLSALNFPDCIFRGRSRALGRLPQCQC